MGAEGSGLDVLDSQAWPDAAGQECGLATGSASKHSRITRSTETGAQSVEAAQPACYPSMLTCFDALEAMPPDARNWVLERGGSPAVHGIAASCLCRAAAPASCPSAAACRCCG